MTYGNYYGIAASSQYNCNSAKSETTDIGIKDLGM